MTCVPAWKGQTPMPISTEDQPSRGVSRWAEGVRDLMRPRIPAVRVDSALSQVLVSSRFWKTTVERSMGYDETQDVLALAELEEADRRVTATSADPLTFRWALPMG
jgi:hypothetical protein